MPRALFAAYLLAFTLFPARAAEPEASIARGRAHYMAHCLICHQVTGQGTPGVFPPLAKSDFLAKERQRSLLAVLEGLSDPIVVNGRKYHGVMPAANLDDQQVADLFTFMLNSWGNPGGQVAVEEVAKTRAQSRYPTYEALVQANSFAPLPPAPGGYALREVLRLPEHAIRIIPSGLGEGIYVLGDRGNVWHLDPRSNAMMQVLSGRNYLANKGADTSTWGLALGQDRQLFIVANRRDESGDLVTNHVVIYRTTALQDGHPAEPKPWFETAYPWGVGPFNHCVNHAAIGPDGYLYINSGSRTDGNEPGEHAKFWKGGEHPHTACLWRLDPKSDRPAIEIFARGLRNAFGFCWNDRGELFATDNGPDAHAPEELNLIERGRHYGFPYQFSDWTEKPYPYTPDPPAGLEFTRPIPNLGPDAGFAGQPVSTFDPHSSPAGIIYLGADFPGALAGSFLAARVGNLLKRPADVGFDILQIKLDRAAAGQYQARIHSILKPLGRPIDLCRTAPGKVCILEYSRPTNNSGALGFPGRVLELAAKAP